VPIKSHRDIMHHGDLSVSTTGLLPASLSLKDGFTDSGLEQWCRKVVIFKRFEH